MNETGILLIYVSSRENLSTTFGHARTKQQYIKAGDRFNKLNILIFNPPAQLNARGTHHSLRPDLFHRRYLIDKTDQAAASYFKERENLTQAVMRFALDRRKEYVLESTGGHLDFKGI